MSPAEWGVLAVCAIIVADLLIALLIALGPLQ